MKRLLGTAENIEILNRPKEDMPDDNPVVFYDIDKELYIDLSDVKAERNTSYSFALTVNQGGWFKVTVTAASNQGELAQVPLTIFSMGTASGTLTWNGTKGVPQQRSTEIPMFSRFTTIRLYFAQNGLELRSIDFELVKAADDISVAFVAGD